MEDIDIKGLYDFNKLKSHENKGLIRKIDFGFAGYSLIKEIDLTVFHNLEEIRDAG